MQNDSSGNLGYKAWLWGLTVSTVVNSLLVMVILSRLGRLIRSTDAPVNGKQAHVSSLDGEIHLSESIQARILREGLPLSTLIAVLFTADYCGYCPKVISELGEHRDRFHFVVVDHVSQYTDAKRTHYFARELGNVLYVEDPDKLLRDDCSVPGYPSVLLLGRQNDSLQLLTSLVGADQISNWLARGQF